MTIGVISDTHGYLDPKVHDLFRGVEHILHGGDIGHAAIILALEQIAPVTAVLGNNDAGLSFRETELIDLGGLKFLLHHIVRPHAPDDGLGSTIRRGRPHAVVFGHTHRLFSQVIDGVHYLNPGYAGKPRFNFERSVAILHCEKGVIQPEFLPL